MTCFCTACLALLFVACAEPSEAPAAPSAEALPPAACAPPEDAALTAAAVRLFGNPLDQLETIDQVGEVVTEGEACETAHCEAVTSERMAALGRALRERLPVTHSRGGPGVSPHYMLHSIELRWRGGECEVSDGAEWHVAADDQRAFHDAFGAIREAFAPQRPP